MTDTLYAAKGSTVTNSDLYTIPNVFNAGAPTSVGSTGFGITGMAQDPTSGILYGATSSNSGAHPNSLITLDPVTGVGTFIGAFGVALGDIAFNSAGVLYGARNNTGNLYTINLGTGAATLVGASGLTGTIAGLGMSFDSGDVLWSVPRGDDGDLYTVNTSTGVYSTTGALSGAPDSGPAFGVCPAAAFTLDGVTMYAIDSDTLTNIYLCTLDTGTRAWTDIGGLFGTSPNKFDALAWVASAAIAGPRLSLRFSVAA